MVCLLRHSEITRLVDLDDACAAMRTIFADHYAKKTTPTGICHGEAPSGEFHVKSGGTHSHFAVKVNGGFFENPKKGLPAIQGIILLCDATNGTPLAILDSGYLTGLRTAATTGVVSKHIAPQAQTIAIIGTGKQGQMHQRVFQHLYPNAQILMGEVAAEKLSDHLCDVDVLVTCTPSRKAFVHDSRAKLICAIGADSPGKREISSSMLFQRRIVTDILEQARKVGEMQYEPALHAMSIGEMLLHSNLAEQNEKVLYDSTGTALQDLAMARAIFERAQAEGVGTQVDLCA